MIKGSLTTQTGHRLTIYERPVPYAKQPVDSGELTDSNDD